jgi:hypothetical protein
MSKSRTSKRDGSSGPNGTSEKTRRGVEPQPGQRPRHRSQAKTLPLLNKRPHRHMLLVPYRLIIALSTAQEREKGTL